MLNKSYLLSRYKTNGGKKKKKKKFLMHFDPEKGSFPLVTGHLQIHLYDNFFSVNFICLTPFLQVIYLD